MENPALTGLSIKGYKSIKSCDIAFTNINVLIGSNGAGKSNLLSAFDLFRNIMNHNFQRYASEKVPRTFFYNGIADTPYFALDFRFDKLGYGVEIQIDENEQLFLRTEKFSDKKEFMSNSGFRETTWQMDSILQPGPFKSLSKILNGNPYRVYHFHDTHRTANVKAPHSIDNNEVFFEDVRNIAAFLYRLQQNYPAAYTNIVNAVRRVAPYFENFVVAPRDKNGETVFLRWKQRGPEDVLNPSQLSDGTLRFLCLATLLLQPEELMPPAIIIDEPELGLHPYAIFMFSELVKQVALHKQIIIATQSVELLDHFAPDDVIVADRTENGTEFKRLSEEQLSAWLDDEYTLGELWNKNVFGGRVTR